MSHKITVLNLTNNVIVKLLKLKSCVNRQLKLFLPYTFSVSNQVVTPILETSRISHSQSLYLLIAGLSPSGSSRSHSWNELHQVTRRTFIYLFLTTYHIELLPVIIPYTYLSSEKNFFKGFFLQLTDWLTLLLRKWEEVKYSSLSGNASQGKPEKGLTFAISAMSEETEKVQGWTWTAKTTTWGQLRRSPVSSKYV